jgi:AhpD family alkylhydroperoxidase
MRVNYREVLPDALKAMLGLGRVANGGLDNPRLLNLIKIRASQINGCAYCVRLHAAEARELGETDQRLDMVAVWRELTALGARSARRSPGVRRSRCCPTLALPMSSSTSSRGTSHRSKLWR